ncbi:hypothetical protein FA15DRAFT_669207 [Coprinopsis marcescibilis]|uniref:Uncharacterized protein n=1 Tax=Coprinopsis marcescibilis TaxID=230819 RepID=A0A5C3L948_COPMA|nr:hypothetical protein FA15DRAFT_669207 [Coprinopsis marcescibilis]
MSCITPGSGQAVINDVKAGWELCAEVSLKMPQHAQFPLAAFMKPFLFKDRSRSFPGPRFDTSFKSCPPSSLVSPQDETNCGL